MSRLLQRQTECATSNDDLADLIVDILRVNDLFRFNRHRERA